MVGGDRTVDKVLVYIQETTGSDDVRRATMAARSEPMLDPNTESFHVGLELAEEVIATWPDSDEAARLEGLLNAQDNLKVGGTPADFTGTDVDGKEISLYDYRGKVVIVDFWGFW